MLGGVLSFFLAKVKFGKLFADAGQAGAEFDQRNKQAYGLLIFAPQFVVVGQSVDCEWIFRANSIGLIQRSDDAAFDVADL